MIRYTGTILVLCLISGCITVTQESTSPDGMVVKQSVTSIGKAKIDEGLLDYRGSFPVEGGGSAEITSGTGVTKLESNEDLTKMLQLLLPIMEVLRKVPAIAP